MYHYAYLLTFPNGKQYVGARSTKVLPKLDSTYLGSGRDLPYDRHDYRHLVNKVILKEFSTRKELIEFEEDYIINNKCIESNNWYNLKIGTYDKHGKNHVNNGFTTESRIKASKTIKKRNYVKGNRTPAQQAKDIKCSIQSTGIKNPAKGHKGTTNTAFIPWYYIDPNGNYVEVHNETKRDKAKQLGFTERQLIHGFHYTNEHKESNRLPRKGWTFGNLPKP